MKEIYDWVPWFEELSTKIADGGKQYLIEKAKQVAWKADNTKARLLDYDDENIDPFSFFYTLAGNNGSDTSRSRVFPSVAEIFSLNSKLNLNSNHNFIFPTPPMINTLFHGDGEGDPKLLWRLFR